jgi:hypothetical protein
LEDGMTMRNFEEIKAVAISHFDELYIESEGEDHDVMTTMLENIPSIISLD